MQLEGKYNTYMHKRVASQASSVRDGGGQWGDDRWSLSGHFEAWPCFPATRLGPGPQTFHRAAPPRAGYAHDRRGPTASEPRPCSRSIRCGASYRPTGAQIR
jgi:hypothetical protein